MSDKAVPHWMRCPNCGVMLPDELHLEGCDYDGPEPIRLRRDITVGPGVDKIIGVFVAFAAWYVVMQILRAVT